MSVDDSGVRVGLARMALGWWKRLATSGFMFIDFRSDGTLQKSGFSAVYTTDPNAYPGIAPPTPPSAPRSPFRSRQVIDTLDGRVFG